MEMHSNDETRLRGWRSALLRYVQSGWPDLTNRQMALMLVVGEEKGPHTVRGLAARLEVAKPVVTRALNSLGSLGLLLRRRDERDGRSVIVDLTPDGRAFLAKFAAMLTADDEELV